MKRTNVVKILQGGAVAVCVALILGWAALPGYSQYSCTPSPSNPVWNVSGTGNWTVASNWSPTGVPNAAGITVCIVNGTGTTPTTVDLGYLSPEVHNLTLNKSNTLSISGGSILTVYGSTISNAGTIVVSGNLVSFTGSTTFQGGGTVDLAGGSLNALAISHSSPFTNADNTIQGWGSIQIYVPLVNDAGGTVEANGADQSLDFNSSSFNLHNPGSGSVTNNGTFGAKAGNTLGLLGVGFTNFASGTLTGGTWDANGTIQLDPLGVSGGEITTNAANIILDGANGGAAAIVDANGLNALSALANNEGTLTLENGASRAFSTSLTNSGTINVGSGSNLTLTGGYSQTGLGSTNVNGALELKGGLLQLGFGSLTAGRQGEVVYFNGVTVVGGYLMGSGNHIVGLGGASFVGTTIDNGPAFLVEAPTSFTNVTNNGAITVEPSSTLTWNGGSNADSGVLVVGDGARAKVSSFTSSGVMTITGTGVVANSGTNLTLGGGSRTYIGSKGAHGGTLSTVAGTTIELNGGLLDNNGKVSGTLDVNYGSLAEGAGHYGAVNVTNGGAFHPGNSPGIATSSSAGWGAGGAYQFDINKATGTAGTNWSLWNVTGNLDITAGTTPNSQFTIDINSLLASDSPGLLANFNPNHPYTWLIALAGSVSGFDPADFAFDTAGFENSLKGGTFSLADGPTSLDLIFTPKGRTPTPEPSTLSLVAIGSLGLAIYLRRRRLLAE